MAAMPTSYIVLDCESSDLPEYSNPDSFGRVHITQLGWCKVIDRRPTDNQVVTLRLPPGVLLSPGAARVTGLTEELLALGHAPSEVMKAIHTYLLDERYAGRLPVVGHNFCQFDGQALNRNFTRYGLEQISWSRRLPDPAVIDTGAIFKAYLLRCHGAPIKRTPGELMARFAARVMRIVARGVYWNLDAAATEFGVADVRGHHNAGEDALITHRVLEAMRDRDVLDSILFPVEAPPCPDAQPEMPNALVRDDVPPQ